MLPFRGAHIFVSRRFVIILTLLGLHQAGFFLVLRSATGGWLDQRNCLDKGVLMLMTEINPALQLNGMGCTRLAVFLQIIDALEEC